MAVNRIEKNYELYINAASNRLKKSNKDYNEYNNKLFPNNSHIHT